MKIPDGYTEGKVVKIIEDVSRKLSNKFKFGYHERQDMAQKAALFAWEGLAKYDGRKPLENFLWVHVRNRLFNYKRNNFGRPDKPCNNCPLDAFVNKQCTQYNNLLNCEFYEKWYIRNSSRQNLMGTREYFDIVPNNENDVHEQISTGEIVDIIEKNLPAEFRKDWVKLKNNIKIPKRRRTQILELVKGILNDC